MVKTKLVEALISDGASILRELDRRNFPVEAMFWILLPDQDYWRLVIGSPIVREQGSAYGRLDESLQEIELAGVTLGDISVFDPESPEFRSLFPLAGASSRVAAGAAWLEFDQAVVYRWTGAAVSGELTCDVPLHELNEIERKTRNLSRPALLVSLEKRRITLRFHPQHGPGGEDEIARIRPIFASALRNTRPDCQINWI